MWNESKTELKALIWSHFVHVNIRTGKSEVHSEMLTQRFKDFEIGLQKQLTFDQRLSEYRSGMSFKNEEQ